MFEPFQLVGLLVFLGMAPFLAVMATSFTKLVVVFQLLRNALGAQQIPPNMVLNAMAIILSIYIMAPVGQKVYASIKDKQEQKIGSLEIIQILEVAKEPVREFLKKHANEAECNFFAKSVSRLWPEEKIEYQPDEIIVLLPAFMLSELTRGFQIGFLLFLPFVTIDIIISNILMAMGMQMVSPTTVSLPFKLLLFVFINGWTKVVHGLILTYA